MTASPTPHVAYLINAFDAERPLRSAGFLPRPVDRTPRAGLRDARVIILQPRDGEPPHETAAHIRNLRRRAPFTDVLIWHPQCPVRDACAFIRAGAREVIDDPSPAAITAIASEVIEAQTVLPRMLQFEDARSRSTRFEGLVSRSDVMWDLFEQCVQIAPTDASVLLLGETGTGKELLARAIHRLSQRSGRFVALNCGAVPESLFEDELFGHIRGSFTGATRDKQGLFRNADEGTLFLDEIGNIPIAAQYSLLRTLQEGSVRPVGSHEEVKVDARVIAATNSPLEEAVSSGRFREDLFFRLDVIRLIIPPLRKRPEDILHLFGYFLKRFEKNEARHVVPSSAFLDELLAYSWPGNVRELENFTHRLVLLYPGKKVTTKHFRRLMRSYDAKDEFGRLPDAEPAPEGPRPSPISLPRPQAPQLDISKPLAELVDPLVDELERRYLEACLKANSGRIEKTAAQAGVNRRTLLRKLKKHEIDKRSFK